MKKVNKVFNYMSIVLGILCGFCFIVLFVFISIFSINKIDLLLPILILAGVLITLLVLMFICSMFSEFKYQKKEKKEKEVIFTTSKVKLTKHYKNPKIKKNAKQIVLNIAMIATIVVMLLPLGLTIINSFKSLNDYQRDMWFPSIPFRLFNYEEAWNKLLPYMWTTMLVAIFGCGGMLVISSIASYAIGKIQFAGHKFVYALVLGLMMLPGVLTLVPSSLIYKTLQIDNTIFALLFPIWSNGCLMSVFLFVTFFKSLPKEIFEAAKIDGASEFKQYYRIAVPLSAPTIGTCAIIQIAAIWNDYLWPRTINEVSNYTIPAGILYTYQNYNNTPEMFAGYLIAALPLLIIFIFANKYYIEGLVGSSIKF